MKLRFKIRRILSSACTPAARVLATLVLAGIVCTPVFAYATALFSPIVSLFSFNGAALAWIVAWFVVAATDHRLKLTLCRQLAPR